MLADFSGMACPNRAWPESVDGDYLAATTLHSAFERLLRNPL
jgi:hypothetical protein